MLLHCNSDLLRLGFFKTLMSKSWLEIHSDKKQTKHLVNANTWDLKLFMATTSKNTKGGK